MFAEKKRYTLAEFEEFVARPENEDKLFEYIGGEIVEVPANPYSSKIASIISGFIFIYLQQNDIGHLTGEAGGYMVVGELYAPDVAFISYETQAELVETGYNPNPPDLAVEVISPTDKEPKLSNKIGNYLAAGTLVWVVEPQEQQVMVFQSGKPVEVLGINDTLNGRDVLPKFTLPISKIFPQKQK
jgi:Uma2 family endonuclease